jgi:hypothetical protein
MNHNAITIIYTNGTGDTFVWYAGQCPIQWSCTIMNLLDGIGSRIEPPQHYDFRAVRIERGK